MANPWIDAANRHGGQLRYVDDKEQQKRKEEEEKKKKEEEKKRQKKIHPLFRSIGKGAKAIYDYILTPLGHGAMTILDVLDRPRNVVANRARDMRVEAILKGNTNEDLIAESLKREASRNSKFAKEYQNYRSYLDKRTTNAEGLAKTLEGRRGSLKNFVHGIAPKNDLDRVSMMDIVDVNDPGITNPVARFAIDFLGNKYLDPFSAIRFNSVTNAGDVARRARSAEEAATVLEDSVLVSDLTKNQLKRLSKIKDASPLKEEVSRVAAEYGDDIFKHFDSAADQARAGQRALVTYLGEPVLEGVGYYDKVGEIGDRLMKTNIAQNVMKALSTKERNKSVGEAKAIAKNFNAKRSRRYKDVVDSYDRMEMLVQRALKGTNLKGEDLVELIETYGVEPQRFKFRDPVKGSAALRNIREAPNPLKGSYNLKTPYKQLEQYGLDFAQRQKVVDIIEMFRDINKGNYEREIAAGLPIRSLPSTEIQYFPHMRTKEVVEQQTAAADELLRRNKWGTRYSSLSKRKYKDKTIKEINKIYKSGTAGGAADVAQKLLIDDPAKAQALRNYDHARAVTNAEFLTEMVKRYAVDLKEAEVLGLPQIQSKYAVIRNGEIAHVLSPDSKNVLGQIKNALKSKSLHYADPYMGRLEGYAFPIEIADVITDHFKRQDKQDISTISKLTKKFHSWWKPQTLFTIPSYHLRNVAGNIWSNILDNVDPKSYVDAYKLQRGKEGTINLATGHKLGLEDIARLSKETGVQEAGFYANEMNPYDMFEKVRKGKSWFSKYNPLSADNVAMQKGIKAATAIEDNARLANYISNLKKGYNPVDAAGRVNEFLFDYSDLTDFEKGLKDHLVPFYTWWRKNLGLQLKNIAQQPGKYTRVKHFVDAYENAREGPNKEYMPDWLKRSMPIQITGDKKGGKYFPLADWLPFGDIDSLVDDPLGDMLGRVTPLVKMPVELAMNKKLFDKKPVYSDSDPFEDKAGAVAQYLATNLHRPTSEAIRAMDERRTPVERALRPVIGSLYEYNEEDGIANRVKELRTLATIYRKRGETKEANKLDEEANALAKSIGKKVRKIPGRDNASSSAAKSWLDIIRDGGLQY